MSTSTAPPATARAEHGGIPRLPAALIGLVSVGAALGIGHLVAALVAPAGSPYLAVGDTVIRLSPEWLTEFAKTTFGTADKPILLAGMGLVLAGLAAVAGLASRRSAAPGVTAIVVLGLVGALAVVLGPVFAPLDLVAPAVAVVAGVLAFRFLHGLASRPAAAPSGAGSGGAGEEPDGPRSVSRRGVLAGATAAVGVGALAAGGGGVLLGGGVGDSRARVTERLRALRLAEQAPPIPPGADFTAAGTPSFITPNPEFYRVDVALRIPTQPASEWSMRVHGMVDRELELTFDDLLARPLVEKTITLTCVSNEVGGPYISTADFVGVRLRDVLQEAGVRPGADQVLSTSIDGWTAGTPTDVLLDPGRDSLLAVGMNGEALPPEHGFPVRMVVPGLYGFVSATKWVTDLKVTTFADDRAYWLQRGWGQRAPIKTQARIDRPKGFAQVPAGRVTVAGIAWSQPIGISKVEVRMDGGPWREAELATEVNPVTWRMWRAGFDLAAGSHTVQVRATDANGVTQPEERVPPIPDGATGWQSVIFNAV